MEEKKLLRLVKVDKHYKLIVEEELEGKIRHICNRLPCNEWSGTLFYTVTGSFENNDLVIHCKDFFIQDIGTNGFTSFVHKDNIMSYMVDNDLIDCYTGLMHSHCNFGTFFSAEDTHTLADEGNDMNHFVSLIVNDAGTYTAAITRKVTRTVNTKTKGNVGIRYGTFGGNIVNKSDNVDTNTDDTETYIEYYPLDITIERDTQSYEELDQRINALWKDPNCYINSLGKEVFTERRIDDNTTIAPMPVPDTLDNRKLDRQKPYERLILPDALIDKCVRQIVTGSIFSIYNTKLDMNKWITNMESLYEKRFGTLDDKRKDSSFYDYANNMIEFLLSNVDYKDLTDDIINTLEGIDGNLDSILAEQIVDRLVEISPSNPYLDYYISELEQYI